MSADSKRRRGRPAGASRYQVPDRIFLTCVADRLLQEPHLTATEAIRHCGESSGSAIRRLQRRWKSIHAELLAEASQRSEVVLRRASAASRTPTRLSPDVRARIRQFGEQQASIKAAIRTISANPVMSDPGRLKDMIRVAEALRSNHEKLVAVADPLRGLNDAIRAATQLPPSLQEAIRAMNAPAERLEEIMEPFERISRATRLFDRD